MPSLIRSIPDPGQAKRPENQRPGRADWDGIEKTQRFLQRHRRELGDAKTLRELAEQLYLQNKQQVKRKIDRDEFGDDCEDAHPQICRSPWECPEHAYRRGAQQGAHELRKALKAAGLLSEPVQRIVDHYVDSVLHHWRYPPWGPSGRPPRLPRRFPRDRIPRLDPERLRKPWGRR
jgi:hypothetical protein